MNDFLNTKITQTWGSQLVWLVVTITLTLLINTVFQTMTKRIINFSKTKIHKYRNKPIRKQRRLYYQIKRNEKKKKNKITEKYPSQWPPTISFGEWRKIKEKLNKGDHLEYKKLENLILEYEENFPKKLEQYYEAHPDEKAKLEKAEKAMQRSIAQMQQSIGKMTNTTIWKH